MHLSVVLTIMLTNHRLSFMINTAPIENTTLQLKITSHLTNTVFITDKTVFISGLKLCPLFACSNWPVTTIRSISIRNDQKQKAIVPLFKRALEIRKKLLDENLSQTQDLSTSGVLKTSIDFQICIDNFYSRNLNK